jgi:4-hydroxy-3-polyprenylbenzoate decarboxylase
MQVFGPNTTGMHWHKHKTGARHFEGYKKAGMRMPVSVVLGGDPAYTYAATAPLPDNIDEYMLAGFLRKKKVELVKCLTNDLEVPADADFIIEGYVDPDEEFVWEGPFGDHTGFYSLADWYPKFHVTCITHRKDAVYPATIVGIPPQEDAYIGLATEKIFLSPMKMTMIPELLDMYLPPAGVAHNLTLARISKNYAGQALKVMNAMWGAGQMMFNKILIVTDDKIDIRDLISFARIVSERVNPARDILFSQGPMDVLDHSSDHFAFGSKMGIDASAKFKEEQSDEYPDQAIPNPKEFDQIANEFDAIEKINSSPLSLGISMLIIGINKTEKGVINETVKSLLSLEAFRKVKFLVFVDAELDVESLESVAWFVTGNIDPRRDCRIIEPSEKNEVAHLVIDGTRKSAIHDDFRRDWPNPVVSSEETIKRVDKLWPSLGLGEMIVSPSLKYLSLKRGDGAISQS